MRDHEEPSEEEIPEGAAVFPTIPAQAGVDPIVLALLHAVVFLEGSSEEIVHPGAALEALDAIASYLERLDPGGAARLEVQLAQLRLHALKAKWTKDQIEFLKEFPTMFGVRSGTQPG